MNQGGRLEHAVCVCLSQVPMRDSTQLVVKQRNEGAECLLIAPAPSLQQPGNRWWVQHATFL
jgi:hypothetical protein